MKYNQKNKIDGLVLLSSIDNESVKCVFFDPQYRGLLDKMGYGNECNQHTIGRTSLPQMSEEDIISFTQRINDILLPSGHLFFWIDKFHLCEGSVNQWIKDTNLHIVDMITWNKEKMGMGYRTRKQCEYLMVLQKEPKRAKGVWTNHSIRDIWNEKIEKKVHTHQKPSGLLIELIKATTKEGDIIADPCAGSYSVMYCCLGLNRKFIGSDINE